MPNAASRLLFAFFLSFPVACLQTISASIAGLGIALIILAIFRPPAPPFFKTLGAANLFLAFLWLLTPWTTPGEPFFRLGPLAASQAGIRLCLLATIKTNALVIIFISMFAAFSQAEMGNALRALHCPPKLVWLFLLMGRNVHILGEEWQSLRQAAKLRAFRPGNNANTYRTFASMLAILLARCQDRAERMREAMLLRGFNGQLPAGRPMLFHWPDYLLAIFLIFCLVFLYFMEYGHEFY